MGEMSNNRNHLISFFMGIFTLALIINVSPSVAKESLIQGVSARRDNTGGVIVYGKAKLPKNTKIWIEVANGGQAEVFISDNGKFEGGAFTNKGKPYAVGNYKIVIESHFTKYWQTNDILSQVGEGGKLLPSTALIPDDPEFPNSDKHLKQIFSVAFPNIPTERLAIESVKNAKLAVTGKGRSADTIKDVVEYFRSNGGFEPIKWSAKLGKSGTWIVTLDCIDSGKKNQAQWSFNPISKKVIYLDPFSKILSWTPSY